MPIMSQTRTECWVNVAGRCIKILDNRKTQSVNLCTLNNLEGEYEQKFYFRGNFRITGQEVDHYTSLEALTNWLRNRSYYQIQ